MKYNLILFASLLFFSCQNAETSNNTIPKITYPEIFNKILDAHGGLDTWNEMNTLYFSRGKDEKTEYHTTDLKTRKSKIEIKGKYELGFDGKEVWVSPHRDSFPGSSPKFMHNLHFYFVAIPFVLADPGVNLEDLGEKESGGKKYRVVKATFDDGVGEASGDHYSMYVDPTTFKVDFITYSVTYFDKTKATKYNALRYNWKKVNGLLAPESYVGYKWENEELGEQRYESGFSKMDYSKEKINDKVFAKPEGAFVDE